MKIEFYKNTKIPDVKSDDDGQGQDDQCHYPGNIILIELEKYLFYVVQEHHWKLQHHQLSTKTDCYLFS